MQTGSKRWIVVGLGNPGEEYQSTRHNIGAMVVDHLANSNGVRFSRHKSRNDVADVRLPDGSILVLAKPHSYMNTLGSNVRALADFYSVTPECVIACHDELDIDFATLGTPEYHRLRLGIGRPPGRQDPADFVLRRFSAAERDQLDEFLERASDALVCLVSEGLSNAQSRFNS